MFNILDKFQLSFNKISQDEKEELQSIMSHISKLTSKSHYDEALDFLRSKLNEFQNPVTAERLSDRSDWKHWFRLSVW